MEWINFSLDNDKKVSFEHELMPSLCNRYGSLLEMFNNTWSTYFERIGLDSYRCFFCSDSPLLMKSVKEFVGETSRIFTLPDVGHLECFGPDNLKSLD